MERQKWPELKYIRPDHVFRYKFAAEKVDGRVLDAACGTGYGSKILHDAGNVVVAVDIEPSAIQYAEEHYPGPGYLNGDIFFEPWAGQFDWVVSFETVEHLINDVAVLQIFREVGSNLIVSVPNERKYPFDPIKFANDKYPHKRHYTPEELDECMKLSGWEVVSRHCQIDKQSPVIDGTDGMFILYICR